jgi:hypothetical protein
VQVVVVELVARRKRVKQRQRERNVLRDPLGVELVVGLRKLRGLLGEEEGDRGVH